MPQPNETLALIAARASVRKYADRAVEPEVRDAILTAAVSAPTAGAMMLYSIIDVRDQTIKDRLAVLCDNQPFIARAPFVLIFVADYRKWLDLFAATACADIEECVHRDTVAAGDLLLACQDAVIAAQTAVIAAESLGLGSCYIGDILENREAVAELLDLPAATLPISMLVFGYPHKEHTPTPHATEHMVMVDRYQRAEGTDLDAQIAQREELYPTRCNKPGVETNVQALYARKFTSDFMDEMNRSAEDWLDNWRR
jgi:nitroreductase